MSGRRWAVSERLLILCLAVGVLLALALLLPPRRGAPGAQLIGEQRTLRDGTTVVLEAMTTGPQHEFNPAPSPWGWVRPLTLGRWGPPPGYTATTQGDGFAFWFMRRDAAGRYLRLDSLRSFTAYDDHGCALMPAEGCGDVARPFRGLRPVEVGLCSLDELFPRRGDAVRLRLWGQHMNSLCEFVVSRPAAAAVTEWQAQALPITQSVGNASFTLEGVKTWLTPGRKGGWWEGVPQVEFRLRASGPGKDAWEPDIWHLTLSDATGNTRRVGNIEILGDDSWRIAGLCPYEPAWKLRVPLSPRPGSNTPGCVLEYTFRPPAPGKAP